MPLVMIKSDPRAREKPCIRCGYSLRKVTDSIRCPECGLSVWLSLNQNDTLDNSNPEWLRRTALACWLLAAACVVSLVASLPQMKFTFDDMLYRQERLRVLRQAGAEGADAQKLGRFLATTAPPRPNVPLLRGAQAVGLAALLATFAGLFLLTTHEGRYPDKLATYRVFARVLCAAAALAALLSLPDLLRDRYFVIRESLSFAKLVGLLGLTCAAAYLRELARRAPNPRLARFAGWLAIVPMISLFYTFIRNSDWLPDPFPLLFLPAGAVLFVVFARLLKRDARLADKNWSTETAPEDAPPSRP
jgi:hypothetical protein